MTTQFTADGILITDLAQGGPAEKDGRLHPGDTLLGVAEETLFAGKSLSEVSSYLRGGAGTRVRVIVRPKGTESRDVRADPRVHRDGPAVAD